MVDNSIRIAIDPFVDQDLKKEYQSYLDMNKYELIIWYFYGWVFLWSLCFFLQRYAFVFKNISTGTYFNQKNDWTVFIRIYPKFIIIIQYPRMKSAISSKNQE